MKTGNVNTLYTIKTKYMTKVNWRVHEEEIKKLSEQGMSSKQIAKHLGHPDKDRQIRDIISKKAKSVFEEKLEDAGLPENWSYGWLKTKEASVFIKNPQAQKEVTNIITEAIQDAITSDWWKEQVSEIKPSSSGNLLVPCIFDLHLGKLAWGEETGEDYDAKIAIKRFKNALDDLIVKSRGYSPQHILFPVGNDLYNSDKAYPFAQTTAGTPQMDDLRWQKMFRMGVQLITEAVIKLSHIAPVTVITVFSNHDHERVFYLGETLTAMFDTHPNVTIDNSPKVRKYFKWGEVLIGTAHGHNEKPTDLPLIMAQENPKDWATTFYREWLLGHLHHKQKFMTQESKDYRGVRVTYLTSPSASDSWHFQKSFTGAIKGAEGFIYNDKEGLIGTVVHNIK
jgi:hypothetical protein